MRRQRRSLQQHQPHRPLLRPDAPQPLPLDADSAPEPLRQDQAFARPSMQPNLPHQPPQQHRLPRRHILPTLHRPPMARLPVARLFMA